MPRFIAWVGLFVFSLVVVADNNSYKLAAGDVLRIDVYDEPELSFERILIGESGKFPYPFLGEVKVDGITLAELERTLLKGLKPDYLLDPRLSVSVVEYRPFFVSGEVKKPGSHAYQPGIKLRQAISLAGGFTERASSSKIYVVRENDPTHERRKVDLNYRVLPGDTITVEQSLF
jgi:polysaccharide biosynthesis/export protein VpsN